MLTRYNRQCKLTKEVVQIYFSKKSFIHLRSCLEIRARWRPSPRVHGSRSSYEENILMTGPRFKPGATGGEAWMLLSLLCRPHKTECKEKNRTRRDLNPQLHTLQSTRNALNLVLQVDSRENYPEMCFDTNPEKGLYGYSEIIQHSATDISTIDSPLRPYQWTSKQRIICLGISVSYLTGLKQGW